MHLTRAALGVAGVPLLSGCMMMGGWGHTAGLTDAGVTGHMVGREEAVSERRVDAAGDGLAIELSVPVPRTGAPVTIRARLRADDGDRDPAEGEIWLRIRTPGGNVDRIRMQEPRAAADGTHRARYAFATPGTYVVTADARAGVGAHARAVSVTAEVEADGDRWDHRPHWLAPVAFVGGLGMLAFMAVMMGGAAH